MSRERLEVLAQDAWSHRLTVVAAPAGSGKTTLLATWATAARAAGQRVAWYRADETDATASTFLAYLRLAIETATHDRAPAPTRTWASSEAAAAWLDKHRITPLMIVIDDYHHLAGSDAETCLARFIDLAPPGVAVVLGTRAVPSMDISRWRLAGEVSEIVGDDLRFRLWEVERLFREHYLEALRGDELGRLVRRTTGWAAGLQFFHLATVGKSPGERRRLLDGMPGSARHIREYLARNVLDELPTQLRDFLLATCPLGRLSGQLCDQFLGTRDSAALLEELDRRQVFMVPVEDGTYRYHDVLQAHLEQVLAATEGEAGVRRLAARAAALLEQHGASTEALLAYIRAQRWDDAARILGKDGGQIGTDPSAKWLADIEPALIRNDPWLRLASARRLRAEGRWRAALAEFALAESSFGATVAGARCRAERLALAAFLDHDARPPRHWTGILHTGLQRQPLSVHRDAPPSPSDGGAPTQEERLAHGLLTLAAGYVKDGRVELRDVADDADQLWLSAAARIGTGVAGALAGDAEAGAEIECGISTAEQAGEDWLAGLGRGALALATADRAGQGLAEIASLRRGAVQLDDTWGATLFGIAEGWLRLMQTHTDGRDGGLVDCIESLEASEAASSHVGAAVLGAWARSVAAWGHARQHREGSQEAAVRAEGVARTTGVRGALLPAYLALAESDPARASACLSTAQAVAEETGLALPQPTAATAHDPRGTGARPAGSARAGHPADRPATVPGPSSVPPLEIRLLGGFEMRIEGRPVDFSRIKPRHRAILRMLSLAAGRPVHREVLAATFWPAADPSTAARNIQVAISGLRRALGAEAGPGANLITRDGEAYRLNLPPDSWMDVAECEEALATARAAHVAGARDSELDALRRAMDLGAGELLPEDGPADWVVYRREDLRTELAQAACVLATSDSVDDPGTAIEICSAGLCIDPHHDGLWRLLIEAHDRCGDRASAEAARQGYERMLDELGVRA